MSEHLILLYCCMFPGCGKTYNTKFNLKRHVDSKHLKLKTFRCDVCSHEFSSKQNLVEHRYLHTGSTPFTCTLCPLKFRQASQLSLHKRVHVDGSSAMFPEPSKPVLSGLPPLDCSAFDASVSL